jgi:hypothetical protein
VFNKLEWSFAVSENMSEDEFEVCRILSKPDVRVQAAYSDSLIIIIVVIIVVIFKSPESLSACDLGGTHDFADNMSFQHLHITIQNPLSQQHIRCRACNVKNATLLPLPKHRRHPKAVQRSVHKRRGTE